MLCSLVTLPKFLEKHITSIFWVKEKAILPDLHCIISRDRIHYSHCCGNLISNNFLNSEYLMKYKRTNSKATHYATCSDTISTIRDQHQGKCVQNYEEWIWEIHIVMHKGFSMTNNCGNLYFGILLHMLYTIYFHCSVFRYSHTTVTTSEQGQ
jgi:hypothetical protein